MANDGFGAFKTAPKVKDDKIQALYEYEEHYLKLISKHKDEITFIASLAEKLRQERLKFFKEDLPAISSQLEKDGVDGNIRQEWLNRLEQDMSNSFHMSDNVLKEFITKRAEEFNMDIQRRIQEIK